MTFCNCLGQCLRLSESSFYIPVRSLLIDLRRVLLSVIGHVWIDDLAQSESNQRKARCLPTGMSVSNEQSTEISLILSFCTTTEQHAKPVPFQKQNKSSVPSSLLALSCQEMFLSPFGNIIYVLILDSTNEIKNWLLQPLCAGLASDTWRV